MSHISLLNSSNLSDNVKRKDVVGLLCLIACINITELITSDCGIYYNCGVVKFMLFIDLRLLNDNPMKFIVFNTCY